MTGFSVGMTASVYILTYSYEFLSIRVIGGFMGSFGEFLGHYKDLLLEKIKTHSAVEILVSDENQEYKREDEP